MTQAVPAGAHEVASGQSVSFFEIRRQGWTPSNEQSDVDGIRRQGWTPSNEQSDVDGIRRRGR